MRDLILVCPSRVGGTPVSGPFPASGPRYFPGGHPPVLLLVPSKVMFEVLRGAGWVGTPASGPGLMSFPGEGRTRVPHRQDREPLPPRERRTPPPLTHTQQRGTPLDTTEGYRPQTGERVMILRGRYTSCGQTGGLSCLINTYELPFAEDITHQRGR